MTYASGMPVVWGFVARDAIKNKFPEIKFIDLYVRKQKLYWYIINFINEEIIASVVFHTDRIENGQRYDTYR